MRNYHRITVFLISLCLSLMMTVHAEVNQTDSTDTACRFNVRQLIVPGVTIGVGVWGVADGWMHHVDKEVNRRFHFGGSTLTDDVLGLVPVGADILLGVAGVRSRYSIADRALSAATALVLVEASVQTIKHSVTSLRPDGSDRHSFPSGHSARAFMGAELTRIHYGGVWGWSMYGVAAATSILRIGHQRHWVSDVIAGAGFGILSARAAMWLLPIEKRLFARRRKSSRGDVLISHTAVIPYGAMGCAGVAIVHTF